MAYNGLSKTEELVVGMCITHFIRMVGHGDFPIRIGMYDNERNDWQSWQVAYSQRVIESIVRKIEAAGYPVESRAAKKDLNGYWEQYPELIVQHPKNIAAQVDEKKKDHGAAWTLVASKGSVLKKLDDLTEGMRRIEGAVASVAIEVGAAASLTTHVLDMATDSAADKSKHSAADTTANKSKLID
jgi:hypothetical protein